MRNITWAALLAVTFIIGYVLGADKYNAKYVHERELCNATSEMLHQYYQYLDVELDNDGDTIARHNFFWDVVSETRSYEVADSLRGGNWEDFFKDW